jgi:hypothetical protein
MERLGSIDIGAAVKQANTAANTANNVAAGAADAVLKDAAQKFEAFGKEAGAYFEGRARLLSVIVAIVLAFAIHVDAVDLFRTYLRDPNARAKMIEQSQAVTDQYKAARDATEAVHKLVPDANAAPAEVKAEVEKLAKDWKAAIDNVNTTITQYADLGVPIGWTPDRIKDAHFSQWGWFCPANRPDGTVRFWSPDCQEEERTVWLAVPTVPKVVFYLLLGGLLIGLGSPFWYDVVASLTSLRSAAGGATTAPPQPAVAAVIPAAAAPEAGKAQPVTPVGAFQISRAARE